VLWDANCNCTYVNVGMSVELTDRNVLQAYKLGKRLLKNDLSYLITSPTNLTSEYIWVYTIFCYSEGSFSSIINNSVARRGDQSVWSHSGPNQQIYNRELKIEKNKNSGL